MNYHKEGFGLVLYSGVPAFMCGVDMGDPTNDYTHNFGKLMVLYRIIGGNPNYSVSTTHNGSTGFEVKAKNKTAANKLNSYINGITYKAYGMNYNITSVCDQRIVSVSIKKQ